MYLYMDLLVHLHVSTYTLTCFRPEADDAHALQQQLSSVMEQSSSEHDKQLLQLTGKGEETGRDREGGTE